MPVEEPCGRTANLWSRKSVFKAGTDKGWPRMKWCYNKEMGVYRLSWDLKEVQETSFINFILLCSSLLALKFFTLFNPDGGVETLHQHKEKVTRIMKWSSEKMTSCGFCFEEKQQSCSHLSPWLISHYSLQTLSQDTDIPLSQVGTLKFITYTHTHTHTHARTHARMHTYIHTYIHT